MKFHKEGYPTLLITLLFSAIICGVSIALNAHSFILWFCSLLSLFLLITVLQFFRNPTRKFTNGENLIVCPADGKVVVIEKTFEAEYLKTDCMQVSIFMSPINVHINRFPVSGEVKYVKYHPGLFLVAWHPKSSTDNERTTIAMESKGKKILFRQIAGALARRIVYYCKEGDLANQTDEFGFIKFGSRVDLFLPIETKINVKLNDVVKGGVTILGEW
jgi:phosphatidylserine decarboxylase